MLAPLHAATSVAVRHVACHRYYDVYFMNEQYVEFLALSDSFFSSGNYHSKMVSHYVAACDGPGGVPAGTTGRWDNVAMVLPPSPPSRLAGCGIINISYVLKVRMFLHCVSKK